MWTLRQLLAFARREPVTWLEDGRLAACGYPRDRRALQALAAGGVRVIVNLHRRAHPPAVLAELELTEVHLPVQDFTAPTQAQLVAGVGAIEQALADGQGAAVHCGAGLGRTGTLVACYLVRRRGLGPEEAIAGVRAARPGSIETAAQEAAVIAFARGQ